VKGADSAKNTLLNEIIKCRACRFCVDACATYQASEGVETNVRLWQTAILEIPTYGHIRFG